MPESAVFVYNCAQIWAAKKGLHRGEAQILMAEAQATGWQTADAVPYACMGKYLACARLVLGFGADPVV